MMKYRKKPVVIEAFKWTGGHDQTEDPEWIVEKLKSGEVAILTVTEEVCAYSGDRPDHIATVAIWMEIETLEGIMTAQPGDFIIKGIQGEIYPCKPDIFKATYEIVEHDND